MNKFKIKISMIMLMILSVIMGLNMSNWLSMWMSMEINLISFIPIIYSFKSMESSKKCMIYLLVQSLSSMMFMFLILSKNANMMLNTLNLNLMLMLTMMIKMGLPPFHFWLPEFMNKMNWINLFILMIIQKIIPLYITSQIINMINSILYIMIISTIISSILGINQTSLNKMMAFSSMNHTTWMISSMKINNFMWIYYLTLYMLITFTICLFMELNSMFYINQMLNNKNSMMENINNSIMILSMGGIPPFLGFTPKWMVINLLIINKMFTMSFILIMTSIITLIFYLKMMTILMINNSIVNKFQTLKMNKKYQNLPLMTNMMIPISIIISMT
uniref:NADH-ubiquinone oxidoreductase chain 2 n=1 Tax=Cantacader sp. TaxID=2931283 RepID=A0A8T9ZYH8_9HEMI|nr:NADH dehydrogenase subunit 2 [Cantacader sp.]